MNIVFWLLVIFLAMILFLCCSSLFVFIGNMFYFVVEKIKKIIRGE